MSPPPPRLRPRLAARTGSAGTAPRLALLLLAFCIALQGLAMSTQRAGGRLHYHLAQMYSTGGTGVDQHADAEHEQERVEHEGKPGHDEQEHEQEQAHPHSSLAEHGHAIDLPGVVHVAQADAGSPNPHASPPRLPDLDGLPVWPAALRAPGRVERWPETPALPIRSFVGPRLERPPSPRA